MALPSGASSLLQVSVSWEGEYAGAASHWKSMQWGSLLLPFQSGGTQRHRSGQAPPHSTRRRLEQLRHTRDLQGMRFVTSLLLSAEPGSRENLFGIRQTLRVERAAHALHRVEVGLREHRRHEFLFFLPHAVLAGDRAAGFYTESQDAEGQLLGDVFLSRDAAVVEH